MNELNELEKKIFKIMTQVEFDVVFPENRKNWKDEIYSTQQLSKFFLEEMKEAFEAGEDFKNCDADDYLKSKYKI
jgi:hypothetical protein